MATKGRKAKKKKKVLLIEPNYSNKYPPIGLMKLATYYRNRGWEVTFYKGDLRLFVIERIADKCIDNFNAIDDSVEWFVRRDEFIEYIKTRRESVIEQIHIERSEFELILLGKLLEWKDYYWKGIWNN